MGLLIASLILILCADIASTWWLLVNYRKRVVEGAWLAKVLFKDKFIGNLIWVAVRICLVALVIQFMTWAGIAAMQIVTGYAVINNLLVMRRLHA